VYDDQGREILRPLTHHEKEWLNKFYQETIVTSFKQDGTDLYDTVEERRQFWRDNNVRNVCLFNLLKKTGRLFSLEASHLDTLTTEMSKSFDPEEIMMRMEEEGVYHSSDLEDAILRKEEEEERLQKKAKKS